MDVDTIIFTLKQAGYRFTKIRELSNGSGYQIVLSNRHIVNVFNTGTITHQGRRDEDVEKLVSNLRDDTEEVSGSDIDLWSDDVHASMENECENMPVCSKCLRCRANSAWVDEYCPPW